MVDVKADTLVVYSVGYLAASLAALSAVTMAAPTAATKGAKTVALLAVMMVVY